jgi:hypothetical protein
LKKIFFDDWPLYSAILLFLLLIWLILEASLNQNQGHFAYALDDPYIHMAMARNLSQFGVWGVTRYGFTASSSSLLWTLLLSLTYYVGGVNQLAPFLWNLLFAILDLVAVYAILSWYKVSAVAKFVALLGIILLIPLPTLVFSGMEQTLQTLLSLLTVFLAARLISREAPVCARRDSTFLFVLAPLVTAARFEGMFLIAAICGLFLLVKRWRFALGFAICGFLPVVINGLISVAHGWFWFPTSVLLKASLPDFTSGTGLFFSLINPVFVNLRLGLHTLVMLVAVLLFYIAAAGKGSGATESRQVAGAILAFLWIAHLEFVGVSPLYRYDACLGVLTILFLASQLPVVAPRPALFSLSTWRIPQNLACGVLAILLLFPLAVKGGRLFWFLPQCTTSIFQQQYQMGLFTRRYYQGSTVALNDIGAVNYMADIHCLDLWGLANAEVATAKRKGTYQGRDIEHLARQTGTRVAIIYDSWFGGAVPPDWLRVGTWTIRGNVIAGGETVSFYAMDPAEAAHLSECLRDFSSALPREVLQNGAFLTGTLEPAQP